MKCWSSCLLAALLVVAIDEAAQPVAHAAESKNEKSNEQAARSVPQPRLRLVQTAGVAEAKPESELGAELKDATITLQSVAVMAPAIYSPLRPKDPVPKRWNEPDEERFTFRKGGPLLKRSLGRTKLEVGIRPYVDLFAENEQFGTRGPRPAYEFVRLSR